MESRTASGIARNLYEASDKDHSTVTDEIRPKNVWDIETEREHPTLGPLSDIERKILWSARNHLWMGGEWRGRGKRRRFVWVNASAGWTYTGPDGKLRTPETWVEQYRENGPNRSDWVGMSKRQWPQFAKRAINEAEAIVGGVLEAQPQCKSPTGELKEAAVRLLNNVVPVALGVDGITAFEREGVAEKMVAIAREQGRDAAYIDALDETECVQRIRTLYDEIKAILEQMAAEGNGMAISSDRVRLMTVSALAVNLVDEKFRQTKRGASGRP